VQKLLEQGVQLVDVLSAKEYEAEHISRAVNIPLKSLTRETAKGSIPADRSSFTATTATTTSET
jgi:rhodanese-related sulfurtransferase